MDYPVKKSHGFIVGILIGLAIFGFIIWGIGYSLGPDGDKTLKLMLYIPAYLFLAMYCYILIGAFNMGYRVEEERLVIYWGMRQLHIKWQDVNEIIQVKGKSNLFSILGASWPGYMIGLYSARGLGSIRMYATRPEEGFIYLKTGQGFYGITPDNPDLINVIKEKAQKPIKTLDMNKLTEQEKGKGLQEDSFYRILYRLNVIFLILFALYIAVFYPGSDAPTLVVLLLVLAVALFFFNVGNAGRLFVYSDQGGYLMLVMGLIVTGIFMVLSLSKISL